MMSTEDSIEFTPSGEPMTFKDNVKLLLVVYAISAVMHYAPLRRGGHISWTGTVVVILVFTIVIVLVAKSVVKVTLTKSTATLQYDYLNFFGTEKAKIIDLTNAYYEYKPYKQTMRLLIYNNYFSNKVEIRASERRGLSQEQLDDLVEQIKVIKGEFN